MSASNDGAFKLLNELWETAQERVVLPADLHARIQQSSTSADSRALLRSSERRSCHAKAVLIYQSYTLGVVTKDLSRSGIGFFSPIPLESGQSATIILPGPSAHTVALCRCEEIEATCFECGGCFTQSDHPAT